MTTHILVLNAGSSSLKFALFAHADLKPGVRGQISGIGTRPQLECEGVTQPLDSDIGFADGLALLLQYLDDKGYEPRQLVGIGHRIVHGGSAYAAPLVVKDKDLERLDSLRRLAPLHLPFGLGVLRTTRALRPHLPHVACFDTAFHAGQPEIATRLPLPRAYAAKGYRRYGFHGLSYDHLTHALPLQTGRPLPRRLLAAHLGAGASMCAILDGRSVATTMGFSTADGLVMGTRTGSIDPGVIVALLRDERLSVEQLEDLLYRKSGLLGLSGISSDMRELLGSTTTAAKDAIDYYCYNAARHAASLVPAMGGLDAVVFTGGVGEHAHQVRDAIMGHLGWLGVPPEQVHIVPANEELTIARSVKDVLSRN